MLIQSFYIAHTSFKIGPSTCSWISFRSKFRGMCLSVYSLSFRVILFTSQLGCFKPCNLLWAKMLGRVLTGSPFMGHGHVITGRRRGTSPHCPTSAFEWRLCLCTYGRCPPKCGGTTCCLQAYNSAKQNVQHFCRRVMVVLWKAGIWLHYSISLQKYSVEQLWPSLPARQNWK